MGSRALFVATLRVGTALTRTACVVGLPYYALVVANKTNQGVPLTADEAILSCAGMFGLAACALGELADMANKALERFK